MEGSAHYEGRAVDVFVRPISAENEGRGWAIASYLVSQAERLQIRTGHFDAQTGPRCPAEPGRRDPRPPLRAGDRRTSSTATTFTSTWPTSEVRTAWRR